MSNSFFHAYVASSAPTPNALSSTIIYLICNNELIQEWQNVELNQGVILQLGFVKSSNSICFLDTSGNEEYFIQDSLPVIIEANISPFGGSLYYISPEEIYQFTQELSFYDAVYIEITRPVN